MVDMLGLWFFRYWLSIPSDSVSLVFRRWVQIAPRDFLASESLSGDLSKFLEKNSSTDDEVLAILKECSKTLKKLRKVPSKSKSGKSILNTSSHRMTATRNSPWRGRSAIALPFQAIQFLYFECRQLTSSRVISFGWIIFIWAEYANTNCFLPTLGQQTHPVRKKVAFFLLYSKRLSLFFWKMKLLYHHRLPQCRRGVVRWRCGSVLKFSVAKQPKNAQQIS